MTIATNTTPPRVTPPEVGVDKALLVEREDAWGITTDRWVVIKHPDGRVQTMTLDSFRQTYPRGRVVHYCRLGGEEN